MTRSTESFSFCVFLTTDMSLIGFGSHVGGSACMRVSEWSWESWCEFLFLWSLYFIFKAFRLFCELKEKDLRCRRLSRDSLTTQRTRAGEIYSAGWLAQC